MKDAGRTTKLVVCFATIYLVWGSTFLANGIGIRHLPPLLFGGVRFATGGLLLLAFVWLSGRRPVLDWPEIRHILVMGACSVLLSNGLGVWAMQWVPSNQTALLNASGAFWIALLGTMGARAHPLSRRVVGGLLVGFVGVALILWREDGAQNVPVVPQLAILLGALSFAVGTIYYRTVQTRLDILSFAAVQMLAGGLMMIAVGLAAGEIDRWHWSPSGLLAMAYLIVFGSCAAFAAFAWLTRNVAPAQIGTFGYVTPAIATVLGWLVLDERLTAPQIVGVFVILAGVVLVSWPGSAAGTRRPGAQAVPEPRG